MKVLLLGPSLDQIGGISNYYNVIELHKHKKVDYFPVNESNHQSYVSTIRRLLYNYIVFTIKLTSNHYKIVHLNPSLDKKSFFRDAVFIIIARILKKRIIVFFRGWQDDFEEEIKNGFFLRALYRFSFAKADVFILLGNLFRNKLLSLNIKPASKIIIETTIADDRLLGKFNLEEKIKSFDKKIVFLFMARVFKEKGIYIAIDAFHQIHKCNPTKKLEFIIAGDGPELPKVLQYIQQRNIDNIVLTGFISGKEKNEVLAKSHIFLFPTYYGEGLPNCILEAMLYGIPIISRSIAAIPDWVLPHINGFLTKSTDPKDYIPIIQKLINDKELYKEIATNNYEVAKEKFTKTKIKRRILKLYEDIC